MNALWACGEATVRDVQKALIETRPRAYTTIMTILDRLARRGVLMRHKAGRTWIYRAHLSALDARSHAVAQVVHGFFQGSAEALVMHLSMYGAPIPAEAPAVASEDRSVAGGSQSEAGQRIHAAAPQGEVPGWPSSTSDCGKGLSRAPFGGGPSS